MGLAITEEHLELAKVADRFLNRHGATRATRTALEAESEVMPAFWDQLRQLGWLGLHVPESLDGSGFGLNEAAVVVEQFGRHAAPGPFLATVVTSALLHDVGSADVRRRYLPELVRGELPAATGIGGDLRLNAQGTLEGSAGTILGGLTADLLVLRVGADVAILRASTHGVHLTEQKGIDPGRRPALVECVGAQPEVVISGAAQRAQTIARLMVAAEATGIATACTEMAAAYAKDRRQFGREIGTFQAVKHRCADMLVDSEMAIAATWGAIRDVGTADAASAFAVAAAYTIAVQAAISAAEHNIQVHGGIGFTWEHDAHIYLRRALALRSVFGSPDEADLELAEFTAADVHPRYAVDLPPEAEEFREQARAVAERVAGLDKKARRVELVSSGYLTPHWPAPFGLAASPVQQLVIDEEFAGVKIPSLGITGWNVLTIIQHGTPDQIDRWVRRSLEGELIWCQLFSEPGAGSDAAAIRTAGTPVTGGWRVTGQKVWTTGAHRSHWGFATVRTDSSGPKHIGVTVMAIDMSAPGVTVRPLRELTGDAVFNEVFLDDVFVPDDDVVGDVGNGWAVARSALGNERVSIGSAPTALSVKAHDLVGLVDRSPNADRGHRRRAGALVAEDHALTLLNLRQAVRAIAGAGPGPEGNVTKLVKAEHGQRVTEFALGLVGQEGSDGFDAVMKAYLLGRCYTIAGGTSEIVRNQIAERILQLPRDPLQK